MVLIFTNIWQICAVLNDLFKHLKHAQSSPAVKAIVITGANGAFSGGFDINEFQKGTGGAEISRLVNESFLALVETGPKPSVAAIDGIALGGGCELLVSCNARICTAGMYQCFRYSRNIGSVTPKSYLFSLQTTHMNSVKVFQT